MMHIQNRVFALALAVYAAMPIPCQDVLSDVSEAQLLALLVFFARDIEVLDFLNIELGDFDSNP